MCVCESRVCDTITTSCHRPSTSGSFTNAPLNGPHASAGGRLPLLTEREREREKNHVVFVVFFSVGNWNLLRLGRRLGHLLLRLLVFLRSESECCRGSSRLLTYHHPAYIYLFDNSLIKVLYRMRYGERLPVKKDWLHFLAKCLRRRGGGGLVA